MNQQTKYRMKKTHYNIVTGFISKRISREKTLGDRLRSLREERRTSLSSVAGALQIPEHCLQDLEIGRYENLPESIYVRNFIRAYVNLFGRDSAPFLDLFELEFEKSRADRPKEKLVPNVAIKKSYLLPTVLIWRVALSGVLGLALLVYLGFEVRKITTPPAVTIFEPTEEAVTKSGEIVVRGKSEPESRIQINGEDILADSSGTFRETVRLQRGLNLITISAKKRRSKERIIFRRVFYEEAVALR